ncbi:MAG: bifunctional metallophosphatase/5'-nucleotidase [Bacteroidota bacterium]
MVQLLVLLSLISCDPSKKLKKSLPQSKISFTFLQINDVYEIAPLEGGRVGGMARVAQLKKDLLAENENLLFVHAGDFLNPSLIGTMKHEGSRIKGKQMVEVMNEAGVDLVAFGNHEFDLDEEDLQKRINESTFQWLGGNVLQNVDGKQQPFGRETAGGKETFSKTYVWQVPTDDGGMIKVGIFGSTLPSNKQPYVFYKDWMSEVKKDYAMLKANCDIVIGLTHHEVEDDIKIAEALPSLPLIMGGHDHDNMFEQVGTVKIAKADANAKTAYVHRLTYEPATKKTVVRSELIQINDEMKSEPEVAVTVNRWNQIADESFRKDGFDPNEVVAVLKVPLDGRESSIRHKQTNLGSVVANAMMRVAKESPDGAILNSGSIRVDDQLKGNLTQFDIIRTLPFGGKIFEVEMTGKLLKQVLDTGLANKGTGGYLQLSKIKYDSNLKQGWTINGQPLSENTNYKVAISDFLLTGLEAGLDFLTKDNADILNIYEPTSDDRNDLRNDIRLATIEFLKAQ